MLTVDLDVTEEGFYGTENIKQINWNVITYVKYSKLDVYSQSKKFSQA